MKKHKQKMIDTNGFSETGIQTVVRLTSLMRTVCLALLFLLLFRYHSLAQDDDSTIRVGIFQNYPIVFTDDNGVPQGLYVDLLREIANSEGWDIQFVPGTWSEGLERLRSAEIDLMTSIAYLDEREVYMDFSHENVLTMWGQVYVHQDSDIQNILDLQGETVAILKSGINGINFMALASKFDIQCEFRVVDTYAEVAELVASGSVSAGVINNIHGYEHEKRYAIRRSPIIFNPFSLLFAVPEGTNHHLLEAIDSYLVKWRSDPESPYYSITAKWFGQKEREVVPDWVFRALFFGGGLLLFVAVWVFALRHQVKVRTTELKQEIAGRVRAEERARRLLDQQIAVNQLALALGETRDINRIYDTIYQHIEAMVDAWAFVVSFYDDEVRLIRAGYVMFKGVNLEVTGFPPIPLAEPGQGTQSQVIHTGKVLYTPDHRKAIEASRTEYIVEENGTISEGPPPEEDEDSAKSALYIPMKIEGKTIGVMQVQSHRVDAYTQEDIDLLAGMANVAAVAVQNARLYDAVQQELAGRKRIEVALRESEEKYRLLAETARDYIVVHDLHGRITYVNQAGLAFSGYSEEEILFGPITKFVPPEHLEALSERRDKRVRRDGERYLYESEFVNKAGERVPVEVGSSPIEEDGKITSVLLVARDITERMRAEEELKKHREHLEELVRERTAELRRTVNLMAGREVRMAELKGVIRQLRAQLEEAGLTPVADDPLLGS